MIRQDSPAFWATQGHRGWGTDVNSAADWPTQLESQPTCRNHISPAHRAKQWSAKKGKALDEFSLQQRSLLLNQLNFRKNTLEASYKYNVKKSVRHTRRHAVCLPMYANCKLLPRWNSIRLPVHPFISQPNVAVSTLVDHKTEQTQLTQNLQGKMPMEMKCIILTLRWN